MSRSCAEGDGARVAIVGAPTEEGTRLREALAEFGVPGARVDLYGTGDGEVLLSEYDGEARIVQEGDAEEIADHDVIFLCEPGEVAQQVLDHASPQALIIDLQGSLDAPSLGADCGYHVVPHSLSLLLAELLQPLEAELGLAEVVAVVLRPASDYGPQGPEELREQTVRLLNFSRLPVATFGRQLAFNLIPQCRSPSSPPDLEARVCRETGDLLGWTHARMAVKFIAAPLFYGHGLQLRFRLSRSATLSEVGAALQRAGLLAPPADRPPTPIEVAGQVTARLADLCTDGLGGFWLWAAAGETGARGARRAVELAAAAGAL